jgi:secretion/DNA translocation related TadE-like protein
MRLRDEAGSSSVYVVASTLLVAVVASGVVLVAGGLVLHRQAIRAADLAALGGAQRALTSTSDACAVARTVAEANGAHVTSCTIASRDVRVTVEVPHQVPLLPAIRATAAAGERG